MIPPRDMNRRTAKVGRWQWSIAKPDVTGDEPEVENASASTRNARASEVLQAALDHEMCVQHKTGPASTLTANSDSGQRERQQPEQRSISTEPADRIEIPKRRCCGPPHRKHHGHTAISEYEPMVSGVAPDEREQGRVTSAPRSHVRRMGQNISESSPRPRLQRGATLPGPRRRR